jgi:futalosine hydrolase
MNCLLLASTPAEIAPFLAHYRNTDKLMHIDFNLDVLVTGVGLTAAAYTLSRQLSIRKPHLVIQAGVAGCFDKSMALGMVFCVKQDVIADQGVMENNGYKTVFDLKLTGPNQFPYKNKWLFNPDKNLLKRSKLKAVKAISVNEITTGKKKIEIYSSTFKPVIESMEGAAMHYVCLMEKIPFLQIRSTCNYAGERNKSKWRMKEAIENLNKELIRLLEGL